MTAPPPPYFPWHFVTQNIEDLDLKLKEVVGQLDGQVESSQVNAARARRSEAEVNDLKDALKR